MRHVCVRVINTAVLVVIMDAMLNQQALAMANESDASNSHHDYAVILSHLNLS